MYISLTTEQKKEFNEILEALGEALDITKTQYDNLTTSYKAVGEFLENDPELGLYKPVVTPQGSLRLGTIIQPINPKDDLDVDLVFRLIEKDPMWTQKTLKDKVGHRLKQSDRYSPMLEKKEGRRCWTLLYRDKSDDPKEKYHMDILPSVADSNYSERMRRLFSESFSENTIDKISIRITDKETENYATATRTDDWLKSNPDGYALWFANRCKTKESVRFVAESVIPVASFNKEKTVLQRVVQTLKRHRDVMFCSDSEDKPISIIITTLAARAYNGENNLLDGLKNVVNDMGKYITKNEKGEDVIANPVNPEENFADKWPEHPKRKENFYKWLIAVKKAVEDIVNSTSQIQIHNNISQSFGKEISNQVVTSLAERQKEKFASGAALLNNKGEVGTTGKTINTSNTFYGQ